MKLLQVAVLLAVVAVANVYAAPLCTTYATLGDLLTGGGQCSYQNAIFTFTAGGYTGSVPASNVNLGFSKASDLVRVSFAADGGWTSSFSLAYLITIDTGLYPAVYFDGTMLQINAKVGSNVTDTLTEAAAFPIPTISVNASSYGSMSAGTSYLPVQSIAAVNAVTIGAGVSLGTMENTFYDFTVPEPATSAAIGGGLLALGLLMRKFRR